MIDDVFVRPDPRPQSPIMNSRVVSTCPIIALLEVKIVPPQKTLNDSRGRRASLLSVSSISLSSSSSCESFGTSVGDVNRKSSKTWTTTYHVFVHSARHSDLSMPQTPLLLTSRGTLVYCDRSCWTAGH